MKFSVNRETLVSYMFCDEVDVPDEVVAQGQSAIRDYLKDVTWDEMRDDPDVQQDQVTFEETW